MKIQFSPLVLGTILASTALSGGVGSAAPHAASARHSTIHGGSKAKVSSHSTLGRVSPRARPKSLEARDAEEVAVNVSRRARDGGGGMMRLETAPYSVQSVGRQ
ncbi:MAG: TonB-dependent receptor, partial [Acetobacter sp.]|nr:TonB-dependent receptor [Acetobacter sp.]